MDEANGILGVLNFLLLPLSLNPISSFVKIKYEGVKDIKIIYYTQNQLPINFNPT